MSDDAIFELAKSIDEGNDILMKMYIILTVCFVVCTIGLTIDIYNLFAARWAKQQTTQLLAHI